MELAVAGAESLDALRDLRRKMGWGPGREFRSLLDAGHALLLCQRDERGTMVASGVAVRYGPLGFIGSMITLPELQGRGIASEIFRGLMAWLTANGCVRVELEATPQGRPLYERKFGFEPRWESFRATLADTSGMVANPGVVPVETAAQWQAVLDLDQEVIGGTREVLLRDQASVPGAVHVMLPGKSGADAYGLRRDRSLGPVIARTPEAAARVIRTLSAGASDGVACGTGGAPGIRETWERLGFTISDYDTRMTWGAPPDDRPGMLYGLLSGGLG